MRVLFAWSLLGENAPAMAVFDFTASHFARDE